jgi:two-component system nitrogen regulation sensor histidine kinase NtrY
MRLRNKLFNFRLELTLVFSLLLFALYYAHLFHPNVDKEVRTFQSNFLKFEKNLDNALRYEKQNYEKHGLQHFWNKKDSYDCNMHVYRNDSLLFWNTNELPILRFADIHFPSAGIIHLQNGWYFAKIEKLNRVTICASILIKKDYSYENKDLVNDFYPSLDPGMEMKISFEEGKHEIKNSKGEYLFSLVPIWNSEFSKIQSAIFFCLFILVFALFFSLFLKWWKNMKLIVGLLSICGLLFLRYLSLFYDWFAPFKSILAFQPSMYASSELFPNFAGFLINIMIFVLCSNMLLVGLRRLKPGNIRTIILVAVYFGFFIFWYLFLILLGGLIENSNIPFQINYLFELNIYSVIAIGSLGVLFQSYLRLLYTSSHLLLKTNISLARIFGMTFIAGFFYFLFEINFGNQMLFSALFPFLFLMVLLYFREKATKRIDFRQGLMLFFLFALCMATSIGAFNDRKERSDRELYANQLKTDKDIITELEFVTVEEKLEKDAFLARVIQDPRKIGTSEFQAGIERRNFDGYWEQYDMEFFLFDRNGKALVENESKTMKELDRTIDYNGTKSEVDSFSYFIADYVEQYSYLFRMPIVTKTGKEGLFYATMKSKRIPEEIGFPRLLISNQAKVFQSLENYSIAKYYDGQLLNRYGDFSYPTVIDAIVQTNGDTRFYANYKDYSHYFVKKGANDYVVLSTRNFTWFDLLTTFSYLFCFLGILLLPLLFQLNENQFEKGTLTLAVKIQLVLILLVFLSLLIYGWGSGIFVRDQYNEYTNKVISEKLNSVKIEFQSKFGMEEKVSIDKDGNKMSFYLKKFSKVFVTDINFYDTNGYLMASSRPKVFNVGLISEQMNPVALREMKMNYESEYTHQEQIGNLSYSSAYMPYFSNESEFQGFLNLQHFGQQKDFEFQIQRFLTAIINVFMLLLAVSVVIAIFVSGWLTAPLRLLQESFAKVNLGQHNEQIIYTNDDEIGALVKEYNRKIDELEIKAQQLAQSERESAWREMAKQVAHEIKNPLTPMKLGLQHFERLYDPEAPMSKEKFQKVTRSLVEQIDGLTRIANEFSNFAKMPQPRRETIDICALLENVVQVFSHDGMRNIRTENTNKEINLSVDKDMMIRVFNNLIKNAFQAIQEIENGEVVVSVSTTKEHVLIEIRDNGKGIAEEQKDKIFVPYFTTKSTGTGLGLAMVKQMVELHQGDVSFVSEEGKGTSFIVRLER